MKRTLRRAWLAAAALLATLEAADAHIAASRLGDFYAGALHPLSDLQDVILWAALGMLAGSLGASAGRWLVLVFPLAWLWPHRASRQRAVTTIIHWFFREIGRASCRERVSTIV